MSSKAIFSTTLLLTGLLIGALVIPPADAAESYKVIVHASNPAASLSREQLLRFFLKKATTWPSGKAVVPADQVKDSPVRQAFSRGVLNKTVAEVSAYWQQLFFAGRAVPPVEKPNDAAVVAFVADNEGAIGYVSAGADTGGAKVVKVVD